ncbi:DUF5667 domain-containing protein [Chloroflexota bacterium]
MKNDDLSPKLTKVFDDLSRVPARDSQSAARGRLQFQQQAEKLRQSVSPTEERRHKGWKSIFLTLFPIKEPQLMKMKIMISAALALFIFLAASGATVYAAQDDLPGQNLYQVKTWSEDTAMYLAMSEQTRLEYTLDFVDRRVAEASGLISAGLEIPEQLETRLRTQLEQALHLAAGLNDTQMLQQLEQIRLRSENQVQIMNMLMTNAPEGVQPILQRIRDRFHQQVQLVELGQSDPQEFKAQARNGFGPNGTQYQNGTGEPGANGSQNQNGSSQPGPNGTQNQMGTGEPGPNGSQNQNGPGEPQPTEAPGANNPAGPQPTDPPNGYGPGQPQSTVTPVSNGPGPGGSGKP